jgi:hypothetical protein
LLESFTEALMTTKRKALWTSAAAAILILGGSMTALRGARADVAAKAVPSVPPAADPPNQATSDPPFGAFLGACNTDADCSEGNICASYRKRGNHCTHACGIAADCSGGPVARCTKQNRCGLNEPVKTERTDP